MSSSNIFNLVSVFCVFSYKYFDLLQYHEALLLYTFIVPLILVLFRNSEFISSLLGRNITNENFVTFNLEKDSIFNELRLLKFRNNIMNFP